MTYRRALTLRDGLLLATLTLTAAYAMADPIGAKPLESLPLQLGYYVASDTPCAQASNATLLLLRTNGIGGARDFCTFRSIEQTGHSTFRVTEACADFQGGDIEVATTDYEITSETAFTARSATGHTHSARYCAQTSLPPDWRYTAIDDSL